MVGQAPQAISFVIYGEPASKANSRRLFYTKGRPIFVKSAKALSYAKLFKLQCPKLPILMDGPLSVEMKIFYASRRPDLDDSLILDLMQGAIYENDRAIRERHLYWGLDPQNPRSEICVRKIPGPLPEDHRPGARRSGRGEEITPHRCD